MARPRIAGLADRARTAMLCDQQVSLGLRLGQFLLQLSQADFRFSTCAF